MARENVELGAIAEDGNGDGLRVGGEKINNNFIELYSRLALVEAEAAQNTIDIAAFSSFPVSKLVIGDWNMNFTTIKAVTHNIVDWTKIISVKVLIYADDDSALYPSAQDLLVTDDPAGFGGSVVSGSYTINATTIVLSRLTAGWFDSVEYDKTTYNRGFVVIQYEL